jgi:hypothetical protein
MRTQAKYWTTCLVLALGLVAAAQPLKKDVNLTLWHSYGMPSGAFKSDFIDRSSPRGIAIDLMWHVNTQISMGASVAYQDFYQKYPRATYRTTDGADLSAVVSHSVQTTPILFKVRYSPLEGKGPGYEEMEKGQRRPFIILPYGSLAAGGNLVQFEKLLGVFSNQNDINFAFAAHAALGAKIPFGQYRQHAVMLEAGYHLMPYNKFGISQLNQVNLRTGLLLELR